MKGSEGRRGQIHLGLIVILVLLTLVVLTILPMINSTNISGSISLLEGAGYSVLSASEYTTVIAKLDALKVSTDASASAAALAVIQAESAATYSNTTLNVLLLHTENESFLYPNATASANITFTSGAIDTFSAWAVITDSSGGNLSAKFVANAGFLTEIMTHNYSIADKKYIIEIAYDNDDTDVVARVKVRSDWTYVLTLNSAVIPAGATLYYRMMCETAAATLNVDFRYYYN